MSRQPALQLAFDTFGEIVVDLFAGGGGTSTGIEQALGVSPDVAINHDADALAMHAANHPRTLHLREDVRHAKPRKVCNGRPVGLLWLSPDCKHFSKAKGGKPRDKTIRSLAWVAAHWAHAVQPRIIVLENVEEFLTWGPLVDGQPCPQRKGQDFGRFVARLRELGYAVEWRELRACDFGAPTIRKRFFLIARRDGRPIVWPKPTHGRPDSAEVRSRHRLPWRTAAECIDWTLPCPSIFLTREEGRALGVKRPLAEATMRRIAKGVRRYVLEAAQPFIVPVTHQGDSRVHDIADEQFRHSCNCGAEFVGTMDTPCPECHSHACGYTNALTAAHLEQANGGFYDGDGRPVDAPASTITATGAQQRLVVSHLVTNTTGHPGGRTDAPIATITTGGHHAEVRAFLVKFYGLGGQHAECSDPMHTIPTRDRMGLVTVDGTDYAIADIGLRMLAPRELFRAQGFPEHYVIDRGADGRKLPKDAQVRMCGNSVCPPLARALVEANFAQRRTARERAA